MRKIFGLKYNDEIEHCLYCICPEVPFTVREMDYMSQELIKMATL